MWLVSSHLALRDWYGFFQKLVIYESLVCFLSKSFDSFVILIVRNCTTWICISVLCSCSSHITLKVISLQTYTGLAYTKMKKSVETLLTICHPNKVSCMCLQTLQIWKFHLHEACWWPLVLLLPFGMITPNLATRASPGTLVLKHVYPTPNRWLWSIRFLTVIYNRLLYYLSSLWP